MIVRIWHGWTSPQNADRYEDLLRTTIFPGILGRKIPGFETIELLRRSVGNEVEFITIMRFTSWEAVKTFAGPDWETSVVPETARQALSRFDQTAQHYEVRTAEASR